MKKKNIGFASLVLILSQFAFAGGRDFSGGLSYLETVWSEDPFEEIKGDTKEKGEGKAEGAKLDASHLTEEPARELVGTTETVENAPPGVKTTGESPVIPPPRLDREPETPVQQAEQSILPREEKGILPYERCAILHDLKGNGYNGFIGSASYVEYSKPSLGLLWKWRDLPAKSAKYFLTCWVGENDFAWSVPVKVGKLSIEGFHAAFPMGNVLKMDFDAASLEGKVLADIDGNYEGPALAGGALIFGHRWQSMENQKDIGSQEVKSGFRYHAQNWRKGIWGPREGEETRVRLLVHGWYAGSLGVEGGEGSVEITLGKEVTTLTDKTQTSVTREIPHIMAYRFKRIKLKDLDKSPAGEKSRAITIKPKPADPTAVTNM